MKVVLFCGGLGTRLRQSSDAIPKPLVTIGPRPIILHLMKYYAHFGHNEFILCLGYRGDLIKKFFLNFNECIPNNFTMKKGGRDIDLWQKDLENWTISFVDTGLHSTIGERLLAVKQSIGDDQLFLANYSDALSDLPLNTYIDNFSKTDAIASMLGVRTAESFHAFKADNSGIVTSIGDIADSEFWINGGFFIFRNEIFDYINPGEELVIEPFQRLIQIQKLYTNKFSGFWKCMDTFKDNIEYERNYARGIAPWELWNQ